MLLHLGNADAALQHFREAIALDPSYAEAHFNIGSLAASRGDLPGAASQFREAIRLKADWVPPLIGLARVLIAPANPSPGDAAEAVRSRNGRPI